MIKTIYVKDYALIDELEIHPGKGLNIVTGQTGAGKSIIVGALNMILGERADTETIRAGASKAIAEALIHIDKTDSVLIGLLREAEIEFSQDLILRREIRDSGSRAFINDTPVPISVLKQVGDRLVDLHGQHDHQLLLREENHRTVLDSNPELLPFTERYRVDYERCVDIQKSLSKLKKQERELREKQELYRFQLKELENIRLEPDEIQELEAEMKLLDNAEILDQKAGLISSLGGDGEVDILSLLATIEDALKDLSEIEQEFESYLQEFQAASISVQETVQFAERYRNNIEFNPGRLEFLRNRQSDIRKICKKYDKDIPDLISYMEEIRDQLNLADNFDVEIEKIERSLNEARSKLKESAIGLHHARISYGDNLAREIEYELKSLGIEHARFEVRVDWIQDASGWFEIDGKMVSCQDDGADLIRFYISTNKGESPKPLSKTASGGEISRIMLALKSILAKEQSLPVMIFDEIDTGISGEVAEKVGRTMRKLAGICQIIAITHQPQIASQAHHHFKVMKSETADRTITTMTLLSPDEHVTEVASLMSGANVTSSSLQSARELISAVVD